VVAQVGTGAGAACRTGAGAGCGAGGAACTAGAGVGAGAGGGAACCTTGLGAGAVGTTVKFGFIDFLTKSSIAVASSSGIILCLLTNYSFQLFWQA